MPESLTYRYFSMKRLASQFSTRTLFETSAACLDVPLLGKKKKTNEDLPMGER